MGRNVAWLFVEHPNALSLTSPDFIFHSITPSWADLSSKVLKKATMSAGASKLKRREDSAFQKRKISEGWILVSIFSDIALSFTDFDLEALTVKARNEPDTKPVLLLHR